ncbi:MAG: ATP-binding cassette domain-containing protein [Pseudonocardiaceae bacterium]|nr:ATP-binding cassette domain-containing protein [Pseudonocardiaceae bacterium]
MAHDLLLGRGEATSEQLAVRDLTVRFGALTAVSEFSLDLLAARITALIGPNGAGKSTAFNAITGFVPAAGGTVQLGEKQLTRMSPHEVSKHGVVRTFQKRSLFPRLTVRENLRIGFHRTEPKSVLSAVLGLPAHRRAGRELHARIDALAEFVGLTGELDREASTLPYGRQRLLAVAIALAARPTFLLLDEPTAGLNSTESAVVASLLRRVREAGVGVLLVEHDMKFLLALSDHVAVLNAGEKIAEGSPEQIQRDARVRAAYLGERHIAC